MKLQTNGPVGTTPKRSIKQMVTEPTTWAGLFTIGMAVATGGASLLTDPQLLAQVAAGLSLVLAKEPH